MSQLSGAVIEAGSANIEQSAEPPKPGPRRTAPALRWVLRILAVSIVSVIALFVWGFFQPKPAGFAPTDPDEGAFVTEQWTRYTIDATSRDEWVFFDFGQGRSVEATLSDRDWDLAFKRTALLTNSGVTNSAGAGGAIDLGEISLEEAVAPSFVGFVVDGLGSDDEDEDEVSNPAISGWYSYNFITHTVHARDNTYVVRGGDGRDALVHFDSYYCQDESAACITFRYRLIPAVEGS